MMVAVCGEGSLGGGMCDVCEFVTLMGNEEGWQTNLATLILLTEKKKIKHFRQMYLTGVGVIFLLP